MNQAKFERMVAKAVDSLPDEFRAELENIVMVVAQHPTHSQLSEAGLKRDETLLGLYQGVPLTKRGRYYGMTIPDKITIFQKPIEANCSYDAEIMAEIQRVVQHEIAHHFGIGDTRLQQLERDKDLL
jgi:predicted Zn-dependent protease with MMP-like domain